MPLPSTHRDPSGRSVSVRTGLPPVAVTAPDPGVGGTFVEGRDAMVAGGMMVATVASIGALAIAGTLLGAALSLAELLPGRSNSTGAHPGSLDDPPSATAVAWTAEAAGSPADHAARSAGHVGPGAPAPEVAPVLPALGVVTPIPRGGDGPPEGSSE